MVKPLVSPAQARRIALAAQGFGTGGLGSDGAGGPVPATRQLNLMIDRLGLVQIDSVNVFERSHYLPLFARLGAYDRTLLDRLTFAASGRYTEYWAHEAAFLPVASWPLWRWKMAEYRDYYTSDADTWASANGPMLEWLLAELRASGPLQASAIEHESNVRQGPWWGWSDVKRGLEVLFRTGRVVSAGRTRFERTYGLPEQILPASVLDTTISRADAHRELMLHAAKAHGIGTVSDLADYFRLKTVDATAALRDLDEAGEIERVEVPGWKRPTFVHRDAKLPRRIQADALLSPFDPIVWERSRAERMFGFHYRIEIYTPQPKRVFGYYVLPVLQDDALVGRVDLKSDRQAGILRVQAAWHEEGQRVDVERLAALLGRTAAWQGLGAVEVVDRGDLAPALAAGVRAL
ncbi:winged helix-turn-helix domain-containing protein [Frondihabitans sp. PAMC 28766]|uniref:winged helix-turn-helix domain-containing protein n=1 Tax=Frondihabitans sp. PAMC 28766 TaxID=1795630 RepID=UPI001EF582CF|nr:crosslink repair DNA glycosylase YcaQ family protein [Frondihabitans sp. PAMC 28766]